MRLGYPLKAEPLSCRESCFNEAEAHAPRIPRMGTLPVRPLNASMRPRRMRLGYIIATRFRAARSRRFNEAEAHAPRIPQCRRAVIVACSGASMRPRRMRLGYRAVFCGRTRPGYHASMRPRRMRLGYHGWALQYVPDELRLQ